MRTSMNFCKLLGPLLALVIFGGIGEQAFAQLGPGAAGGTYGVVCNSNPSYGAVQVSPIFSPKGNVSVNASKNSAANPVVTVSVTVSMTGCTMSHGNGGPNNLILAVPVTYGNSGAALHSPMSGLSAVLTSATGSLTGAGVGCSANFQIVNADSSQYQVTDLVLYPQFYNATPVFSACNITYSYTIVFFANASFNASNSQGSFDAGTKGINNFNGLTTTGGWSQGMGWGQLGSSSQIGPGSRNPPPTGAYSYVFPGPGFTATLDSCTPWVNLVNSPNGTVNLPNVSSLALNGAGKTTGSTPFTIQLNSCYNKGSNYSATASWAYTPFNGYTNVISNTGSATGVGMQITESTTGNPVLVDGTTGATTWTINSGTNSAPAQSFNAMYYSTGTTNLVGTVSGTANYTMSYN